MHTQCQILDRVSYLDVIRLFYVSKSYPSVTGESHNPIYLFLILWGRGKSSTSYPGEEIFFGREILENCQRWELTLHATMTLPNQTTPHQKKYIQFLSFQIFPCIPKFKVISQFFLAEQTVRQLHWPRRIFSKIEYNWPP